jgi:hypothetical protein
MRTILRLAAATWGLALAIPTAQADQLYRVCVQGKTNPPPCPAGVDGKWASDAFVSAFGFSPDQQQTNLGKRLCTYVTGSKPTLGPYNVSRVSEEGTGQSQTFVLTVHCVTPPYKSE